MTVQGAPLTLTHKEFELLCALADAQGRVLSREFAPEQKNRIGEERPSVKAVRRRPRSRSRPAQVEILK